MLVIGLLSGFAILLDRVSGDMRTNPRNFSSIGIKLAAACRRTYHPRYGPALEIVDRPSANLARLRGTKTVSQARTFQTLNESTQASRAYRRAPSVVDLRPELHPVNWFESFQSPQANLAIT